MVMLWKGSLEQVDFQTKLDGVGPIDNRPSTD